MFESHFFGRQPTSWAAYEATVRACVDALSQSLPTASYAGGSPAALASRLPPWRTDGGPWADALKDLRSVIAGSVAVYHPHTCAHLHCPVLLPALAAEMVLSSLNPSMDSFDQSGAATLIEQQVVEWITRLIGFSPNAAAAFTTGGTQSNYFALLLARDRLVRDRWGWSVQENGLPPGATGRLRIFCSEAAHFSVVKAAHQLGLGAASVVQVPTDAQARMDPVALEQLLAEARVGGLEPIAVVATAGTTDAGAFDSLPPIRALCDQYGVWLHVDAAWGSSTLVSTTHRRKLQGLSTADSVTVDFHKGFYQSISCSALAVRDAASFELVRHHAEYLNPEEHEEQGVPDLVTHSLLTTRRFDALKLWLTLRVVGVEVLGQMVDQTIQLTFDVARMIESSREFELCLQPEFSSVLFRLKPACGESPAAAESRQATLPQRLLHSGQGVIGFSKWRGRRCLKLTLLNPCTSSSDIRELLNTLARLSHEPP